jgi:hypothetical protein
MGRLRLLLHRPLKLISYKIKIYEGLFVERELEKTR